MTPEQIAILKEIVGYAASLIILVSLLMTNIFRLRLINGIGSVLFSIYGAWIGSWPVCAINAVIAGIDVWYMVQSMRAFSVFELSRVEECAGEDYLRRFFLFHERELKKYAPGLTKAELLEAETYLIFMNMLPIGVFAFHREEEEAHVLLDFMIAEYRDFKAGRFVYQTKRMFFKEQGIKRFHAVAMHPSHTRYFQKNGFVPEADVADGFVNEL